MGRVGQSSSLPGAGGFRDKSPRRRVREPRSGRPAAASSNGRLRSGCAKRRANQSVRELVLNAGFCVANVPAWNKKQERTVQTGIRRPSLLPQLATINDLARLLEGGAAGPQGPQCQWSCWPTLSLFVADLESRRAVPQAACPCCLDVGGLWGAPRILRAVGAAAIKSESKIRRMRIKLKLNAVTPAPWWRVNDCLPFSILTWISAASMSKK